MADDEQSTPGLFPTSIQEFIAQLRTTAENARLPHPGRPGSPADFARPGALSAAQLASVTDSIAAQRRSIEALKAQLSSFDEQLAVLETMLGPLAQWSRTWADLEQRFLNMGLGPDTGG
jgi:hypothetical protein